MLTKAEIRKNCGKLKRITEEEKENWREYLSIIKEIVEDCIQEALE